MNPSGSQGTQCVHQDFLRVVDTDTYKQIGVKTERIISDRPTEGLRKAKTDLVR
jgi:hypothetical protein